MDLRLWLIPNIPQQLSARFERRPPGSRGATWRGRAQSRVLARFGRGTSSSKSGLCCRRSPRGKIRAFLDGEPLNARYWSSVLAKLKDVETRASWAGESHLILAIEQATRSVAIVEVDLVERFPAPAHVKPEPVAAPELIEMPVVDPEPEPNEEPVAESFEDDPATESVEDDPATPAEKEAMSRLQEDYPDGLREGMLIKNLISTMVKKGLGERVLRYALKRLAHDYPGKWAGPRKRRLPH